MNAVDTNVLVYSFTSTDSSKHTAARQLLRQLNSSNTLLLWQVACEFTAATNKLVVRGASAVDAGRALEAFRASYPLVTPTAAVLDRGIQLHRERGVSFWDALLLAACAEAGVTQLYSEDLQTIPVVDGVRIINPFA